MFRFLVSATVGRLRFLLCPLRYTIATLTILSAAVVLPQLVHAQQPVADQTTRPNVVLILADDLGWSDTTLFGTTSLYKTPNIERLAKRGMTFSRAYSSSPLCSPTRASLLTGLSPARTGLTTPNCHLPKVILKATVSPVGPPNQKATMPASVSRLDPDYYTLAEMFRDNGYATGHFGKWHLGAAPYSPLQHGFDVDVPHWPGPGPAGSYVAPWKFPDFDPDTPDQHIEDRMAKEAVVFIEKHRQRPFFLNYWMFSVHAPFDAKKALIDKYRQQVDPQNPQRSPTYAAMIESMDDAVGTLLDTLDRLKIADNTIIVFASDNGGNMYNEVDGTTPTSNVPLRGGKATMYEGGVRGPAIVAVPGRVQPGSRSEAVIQSSDYYPTLLELLGIQPQTGQEFDGISLVPALNGQALKREAIFTYFPHAPNIPEWLPPAVSVHSGDWKLIRIFHGGENGAHRYKLFNLRNDIGEQKNLAAQLPERVKQLDALIDGFLQETSAVLPMLNTKFDPARYQPEREGKAALKGSARKKPAVTPRRPGKPVAGWRAGGTSKLSLDRATLVVESTGGDPHLSFTLPRAVTEQPLTLHLTMTANAGGRGQLFWQEAGVAPAFYRDRSTGFDVQHDGKPHEYTITFAPAKPVIALRLDPATTRGEVRITSMKLATADGKTVYNWTFKLPR